MCSFRHTMVLYCVALCFLIYPYLTIAQNLEITCPAAGFSVGVNATVTCKVNKADFDSVCILPATLIIFYFTPSNGVKTEWCLSSYNTCPNTGTTQVACGTCSCVCETDDGTFLTHRLDFIPTSAHAAGSFSCEVICVNSGNLPALTNSNCDQVIIASPPTSNQAVTVAGKPGASSNGLSTAAAVGVMAAVMTVGVAATVIWMWRRQWILPCASNADSGESRGTPDEHHRPTPAGVLETGGQEDISLYDEIQHSSVQGDPPVPSGYEHLKMQDVGMRSVYSGLRPYPNRARC